MHQWRDLDLREVREHVTVEESPNTQPG